MPTLTEDYLTDAVSILAQTPMPGGGLTNATWVRPLDVVDMQPRVSMPRCGEDFGGFTLIEELGRGAFGRVYLASEPNLANRLVALKVTRKASRESQKLARLQHTNIVPIQNAFTVKAWHVVQMPYFGRQTLAHLMDAVKAEKTFPQVNPAVFASTQMRFDTSRKGGSSAAVSHEPESAVILLQSVASDLEPQPSRELLVGLPYTDAAIWLIARLADGLAHAHAKGILHLDLKPHNVLLSDDGQPMLLDFNLAFDTRQQDRDRVGGTWPYMSPEQICEYTQRPGAAVDARSDLYSLGVMFFELLTLRQPFKDAPSTEDALALRMAGAADVRAINPHVPVSIAAVVAKLLDPIPARRYPNADALREDLRRHAEHRPLLHASDASLKERATKWHRRNPRLSLMVCAGLMGIGLLFSAAQMMSWSKDRKRTAAVLKAQAFRKDFVALQADLAAVVDADRRNAAIEKAKAWLNDYHVDANEAWKGLPDVRLLPETDASAVRTALAETALLTAHAEWVTHRVDGDLDAARSYNRIAAAAFGTPLEALAAQRDELKGRPFAKCLAGDAPADLYASAARLIVDGRFAEALKLLLKLTQTCPDHYAAQLMTGCCYDNLGQLERATERFQIAKPLGPHDARPAAMRAAVLARLGKMEEAEADLDEALRREPAAPYLHLQRAYVRNRKEDMKGTMADLNAEIANPKGMHILAYALRGRLHEKLNDSKARDADYLAMDTVAPQNDLDHVARATRWLKSDPAKAIAEYNAALKLNPDCYSALHNKAHAYSDQLHQPGMAMDSMKKAVERWPYFNRVRSGHAVLLARLGQHTDAASEAEAALQLGSDPFVTYQASNVYALGMSAHGDNAERALALFRQALREGFRDFALIAADPDMDNLRDLPAYQDALKAAQELVK